MNAEQLLNEASSDTPAEIRQMVRARVMALSGAERIKIGAQMFESARALMLASFPPGLPAHEIKRRLFLRCYGNELNFIPDFDQDHHQVS